MHVTSQKPLMVLLVAFLCIVGCAGQSVYVSPGETTQLDAEYSDTDMRQMASAMYTSLQLRISRFDQFRERTPIVALLHIRNTTSEHIDTDMISDKLQIELLRAGTMRFVDRSKIRDMAAEFDLGGSGLIDPAQMKKAGKVLGADLFLYGELGGMKKAQGKTALNYYRLSMKLMDAETNEIMWADDFEVKKMQKKGWIEW